MANAPYTQKPHVVLFFGSFSPMHVGHLCLANYVLEQVPGVDELWMVLTPSSPFKQGDSSLLLPDAFRVEWARFQVQKHPRLKLCTEEFELPRPSYTFNSLLHYKETYPAKQFAILMGMDSLQDLPKWYRGDEIISGYTIYVYPRPGYTVPDWAEEHHNIVVIDDVPLFEVSGTFIRESLAAGYDLPYFLNIPMDHPLYCKLTELLRKS